MAWLVVNPRQVRDFARATGLLAKTDRLDAAVLARYAEAIRPEPRAGRDRAGEALADLLARRRQLVAMTTAENNRLGAAVGRPASSAASRRICAGSTRSWPRIEEELREAIDAHPAWRERLRRLQAVPGVGKTTAQASSPTCRNWEPSTAAASPPSSAWRRSPATAA